MKQFKMYLGGSGQVSTYEVTSDPPYKTIVETVSKVRQHLLTDLVLRQPLLHIFESVYREESEFPDHLRGVTPPADQIPNKMTIQQQPCDNDGVDFVTNAFPDLYLQSSRIRENSVLWEETPSGRQSSEISINLHLIQLWNETVSVQNLILCTSGLNLYSSYQSHPLRVLLSLLN